MVKKKIFLGKMLIFFVKGQKRYRRFIGYLLTFYLVQRYIYIYIYIYIF